MTQHTTTEQRAQAMGMVAKHDRTGERWQIWCHDALMFAGTHEMADDYLDSLQPAAGPA